MKPHCTILRGIPGSGKSTIARILSQSVLAHGAMGAVIVSSDAIRAELYGSEETQGNGHIVFSKVRSRIAEALNKGFDVIVDTTGISMTSVRQFEYIAKHFNATSQIVEVRPSLETCKKRNSRRTRVVPEHVIDGMYQTISRPQNNEPSAFDFSYGEGQHYVMVWVMN